MVEIPVVGEAHGGLNSQKIAKNMFWQLANNWLKKSEKIWFGNKISQLWSQIIFVRYFLAYVELIAKPYFSLFFGYLGPVGFGN